MILVKKYDLGVLMLNGWLWFPMVLIIFLFVLMVFLDNWIAWEWFNGNWNWFWSYYAPNVFDKMTIIIFSLH